MSKFQVAPATTVGTVHLIVPDLERSLQFYGVSLGLKTFSRNDHLAQLGAGDNQFLTLTENRAARHYPRTTGLYHFAILAPSRRELARVIQHFVESNTAIQGAADHLVSEALYLADPDNNGIEIYRDRPRSEWKRTDGGIQMATNPLDLDGIMRELDGASEWKGIAPETRIGHIHLKVTDIAAAEHFYCDVLGFDLMARYGDAASFVSAGGYHHHIGMNTWESLGAPPPPPDAVGLRHYTIRLPDDRSIESIVQNLKAASVLFESTPEGVALSDPSSNRILLARI